MRNFLRSITPSFLLNAFRKHKKNLRRKELENQQASGLALTIEDLKLQLREMGIHKGDTLLVHSSMSKIGYLQDGPKTVVDALLLAVGKEGNLLMPSSPVEGYQLEYIRENKQFDVLNTPSKMGAITEYFRQHEGVKRSVHPTEPVCAYGPDADYLTNGHLGELTPYTGKSPFYRVAEKKGKILMAGVTLDNAGTNLHTLEDAVEFAYPIYDEEIFEVEVVDEKGKTHRVKTKVHSPVYSKKRRCDELIPLFEKEGALTHTKLGDANCLLLDAKRMFDVMVEQYKASGVTMYTPHGVEA